jgi:hypothetical protein
MMNRFATGLVLLGMTLPLTACSSSGGDDDDGGTPQTSPWSGHTYLLSIAQRDWTTPRGIGTDLFGVAPAFILKVTGTGNNLTATVATAPGTYTDPANPDKPLPVTPAQAMQEPCGPTTNIPFSAAGYPMGTIGPTQVKLFVRNAGATPPQQITGDVYDLKFTNILPNGSTPSTTGTLEATMDFRQLYILFASLGPTRDKDSVCKAFSDAYTSSECVEESCKVKCGPCPDGQPYCLAVKAEGIGAVEAPNLVVTDVTQQSRPATCADSPAPGSTP